MNTQNNTEKAREPINKSISKYHLVSKSYRELWNAKRRNRTI